MPLMLVALLLAAGPVAQAGTEPGQEAPAAPAKHKATTKKKAAKKAEKYTCPMDPDVVSDKPGKCPKCGMDLEKVSQAPMAPTGPATTR